ncbi:type I toxin-antitoxin system Hok family toxin [Photorhabdus sp. SF281]
MKQQKAIFIAIVICIAALAAGLVTRKDLCEVRIRSGQTEVAVFMDYETR